ncbi:Uncharacterised protein [Klebsiella variicola]|nr:Uncharacterised protein [Klebsiella variicola]
MHLEYHYVAKKEGVLISLDCVLYEKMKFINNNG